MIRPLARVFLSTSIAICLPFCILALLPIYILRWITSKLAKCVPELGKMLTTKSACVGVDDICGSPQWTLLLAIVINGSPSLADIQQRFLERAVKAQNEGGQLLKPELSQFVTSWLGFLFWKWDSTFDIQNHIREYSEFPNSSEPINQDALFQIGRKFIYAPFAPSRSPWELIVVRNVDMGDQELGNSGEQTGIFLRAHHVLADGFSLMKLFIFDICAAEELRVAQPRRFSAQKHDGWSGKLYKFLSPLFMFLRAPIDIGMGMVDVLSYNENEWHVPESQLTRRLNSAMSSTVSVQKVKEVKNSLGCSFATVLLAMYTGAMRRFMTEAGYKVPGNILCAIALPVPHHPQGKLRNHATGVLMRLPTGAENPLDRLKGLQRNQNKLKSSTLPVTIFYAMTIIGGLFAWMTRLATKNTVTTAVASIFPGPNESAGTHGFNGLGVFYAGGLTRGNTGIGFSSLSYNNKIFFIVGVDEGIVGSEKLPATKLLEYMEQELELITDIAETQTRNGANV